MSATTSPPMHPNDPNRIVITITNGTRTTVVTRRKAFVLLVAVFALIVALVIGAGGHDNGVEGMKRLQVEGGRTHMEELADAGNDRAALWLLEHFPGQYLHRVDPLAAKGYPEALYLQGVVRVHRDHDTAGRQLIEAAAGEGYFKAIQYLKDHPAPLQGGQ